MIRWIHLQYSVSRSCGHTKHWQTHLVKGENEQISAELCDSPGLVFPVVWKLSDGVLDSAIRARQIYEVPRAVSFNDFV